MERVSRGGEETRNTWSGQAKSLFLACQPLEIGVCILVHVTHLFNNDDHTGVGTRRKIDRQVSQRRVEMDAHTR
jgi:hypothetical protein